MKLLLILVFSLSAVCMIAPAKPMIDAKDLIGAWGMGSPENKTVMITTGKVFSVATYNLTGKKFISSYGGVWHLENNKLIKTIEWNSLDSTQVGKVVAEEIEISKTALLVKSNNETWARLDNGQPGALMGAWVITGNYQNDTVSKRPSPFFPRRTMKLLSGKYFHWVAYNIKTKSFANAGGGTYSTVNGKYTENIEFFTKTAESIGKTLTFEYSFVGGDWRHKGEKSTGGALDECWSNRETLEK